MSECLRWKPVDPNARGDWTVLHFIQAHSVNGVPKGKLHTDWEQADMRPADVPFAAGRDTADLPDGDHF
jgi:hypothetical protein